MKQSKANVGMGVIKTRVVPVKAPKKVWTKAEKKAQDQSIRNELIEKGIITPDNGELEMYPSPADNYPTQEQI